MCPKYLVSKFLKSSFFFCTACYHSYQWNEWMRIFNFYVKCDIYFQRIKVSWERIGKIIFWQHMTSSPGYKLWNKIYRSPCCSNFYTSVWNLLTAGCKESHRYTQSTSHTAKYSHALFFIRNCTFRRFPASIWSYFVLKLLNIDKT